MSWNAETNIKGPPGPPGSGSGDVNGPAGAVTNRIAVYSDITGKSIKDGGKLISDLATVSSPVFTGDPQAPTPATADNDTSIATTAFVKAQGYAPLASPVFTGDPQAPTPVTTDNDTSVATTAFVKAQNYAPSASVPAPATATPIIESGTGVVGTSTKYAREDHVHPLAATPSAFPSGTVLLFYQAAAPTGWTKITTQNDKALRVVSGSGGVAGGTNAFSTVMAQTVVGNTTLTVAQVPNLNVSVSGTVSVRPTGNPGNATPTSSGGWAQNTSQGTALSVAQNLGTIASTASFSDINTLTGATSNGGGGSHNHPITMAIQYIDIILASKD